MRAEEADEIEWKDETSYARGERGKVEPRAWEWRPAPGIRVVVYRVNHDRESWYMWARPLLPTERKLKSRDLEEAKAEAVQRAQAKVREMAEALGLEVRTPVVGRIEADSVTVVHGVIDTLEM